MRMYVPLIIIAILMIITCVLALFVGIKDRKEREEYLDSIARTEGLEKARQREYELKQQDRLRRF